MAEALTPYWKTEPYRAKRRAKYLRRKVNGFCPCGVLLADDADTVKCPKCKDKQKRSRRKKPEVGRASASRYYWRNRDEILTKRRYKSNRVYTWVLPGSAQTLRPLT